MAGFAAFLNALSYPIQILVRAAPVDLTPYYATLEERGRQFMDGDLSDLAHDHVLFVQSLARKRTLLERRFYVVVPSESGPPIGWKVRFGRAAADAASEPRREAAHRQLIFRCEELIRQLTRCGLGAHRLGDLELAQLFLACWSPEKARAQRFRQRLDDFTTLAVRAAAGAGTVD